MHRLLHRDPRTRWLPCIIPILTAVILTLSGSEIGQAQIEIPYGRYLVGDADASREVDLPDAYLLVNYLYCGGTAPLLTPLAGDANIDGWLRLNDVIVILNQVLRGVQPDTIVWAPDPEDPEQEAEWLASWLAATVTAPDDLKQRVGDDLRRLHYELDPIVTGAWASPFQPPWVPGWLMLIVEETAFEEIKNGTYHEWDDLFALYPVDTVQIPLVNVPTVTIIFENPINTAAVAPEFLALPGIVAADPDLFIGCVPSLSARPLAGDTIGYVMRLDIASTPWGCHYIAHWYFKATPDDAWLVGRRAHYLDVERQPWWDEADSVLAYYPWGPEAYGYGGLDPAGGGTESSPSLRRRERIPLLPVTTANRVLTPIDRLFHQATRAGRP